jgi:hypothetical protein
MFTNQPTLYGTYVYANRIGGVTANLYAYGLTPPILSLSDSVTNTDTKPVTVTKPLTIELLTLTDSFVNRPNKVLAEALNTQDSTLSIFTVKAITDILLLQDWLSMRLRPANIWRNSNQLSGSVTVARSAIPTLYGTVMYESASLYLGRPTTTVTRS